MNKFGKALRSLRENRGIVLKSIADYMGWSVVYVSDIERGNRRPPARDDIIRLCKFFGEQPDKLLQLADETKGYIELNINKLNKNQANAAFSLARKIEHLNDDQVEKLLKLIDGDK